VPSSRSPRALSPGVQVTIVVALFGIVALALLFCSPIARRGATAAAQEAPEPIPSGYFKPTDRQWESLEISPVRRMAFPQVSETDVTIAAPDDATVQILSPFTGRVSRVFVTTGDTVNAGSALFAGEGNEYAQAQSDLSTAAQALDPARVHLRVTQAEHERLRKLVRLDGATRKDFEQSGADVADARAVLGNAEAAVALARAHMRVLGVSAGSNGTSVTVRAPMGGVITQRAVGAGQYVESAANGSQNPLLTISDLSRVFFVANVSETDVAHIQVGDRIEARLLAFPGRVFDARVNYIGSSIDPATRRIAVRAQGANPDGLLKAGMYGNINIYTGPASTSIVVPEDAVIFEGETAHVWIVGPQHTLAVRSIRAGRTVDGMVEVLGGLGADDRVVTSGSLFIDRAAQDDS
jgi:cobalt-zinc-cadmium efflux system membrane fusion protein